MLIPKWLDDSIDAIDMSFHKISNKIRHHNKSNYTPSYWKVYAKFDGELITEFTKMECSDCGAIVYVEPQYKFCPMCGKEKPDIMQIISE